MMDEEEREDNQMRDHFKDRWIRTASSKLTPQLRQEGAKYRTILDNATSADGVVKQKYNQHRRALEILSKSDVSPDIKLIIQYYLSQTFLFYSGI